MCEKGCKWVKIRIYHIRNAKEASKYVFSNNSGSPTRGQKMGGNGGNWGNIGEKFLDPWQDQGMGHSFFK